MRFLFALALVLSVVAEAVPEHARGTTVRTARRRPEGPAKKAPECPEQKFKRSFGDQELKLRRLHLPHGLSVRVKDGKPIALYASSTMNGLVQVYAPDGRLAATWDMQKIGLPQANYYLVRGSAVDPETGDIFFTVSDGGKNSYIARVDPKGKLVSYFGKDGDGKGEFSGPAYGVAIGKDGNVYVSDPTRATVKIFTKAGKFVEERGFPGVVRIGFNKVVGTHSDWYEPYGIALDPKDDSLLVVDAEAQPDLEKKGKTLSRYDAKGKRTLEVDLGEEFGLPYGVAVDMYGDIYVSDYKKNRIARFSADGKHKSFLEIPKDAKTLPLSEPRMMQIVGCTIYVADGMNDRIVELGP